jgi:hypothetical protein
VAQQDISVNFLELQSNLSIKGGQGKRMIFDPCRKMWVTLTPEESVRQLVMQYLSLKKGYKLSLISVEKGFLLNDLNKRFDLLCYDSKHQPYLLVECKSPKVAVTQEGFRQAAWYNQSFQVPFLMLTNGRATYCCSMDYEEGSFQFLPEIPEWR